jgi:hypothetical protein
VIVPFIISAILLVMAMLRPVLQYFVVRPLSAYEKASNIFGLNSLSMPMPVSLTQNFSVD